MPHGDDDATKELRRLVREVMHSEGAPVIRAMVSEALREELTNGWGENRRLVNAELKRGDEERKELREAVRAQADMTVRIDTTMTEIKARLDKPEPLPRSDNWKVWAAIITAGGLLAVEIVRGIFMAIGT